MEFGPYQQNDSSEFLQLLLDRIETGLTSNPLLTNQPTSNCLVSNYNKRKRACNRVDGKHCRLTFLFLLSPSNLFHCYCHVSPSILKTPKQVFFFNPINIYFWHLFTITLLYCFYNYTFFSF